jgi:Skp family chaperone for outer membrane proteins
MMMGALFSLEPKVWASSPLGGPIKVRILNISKIMQQSDGAVGVLSFLDKYREIYHSEITKSEESLRHLHKELEDNQNKLTREEFEKQRKNFEVKLLELNRQLQHHKSELEFIHEQAMELIHKKIMEITADICQSQKISLVLPIESVVYQTQDLEITEEVLKRLNKHLPSLDVQKIKHQFTQNSHER